MNGLDVQKILKEKFWKDYSILGSSISEIRTVLCQNDCSGHGVCDSESRACICDTFWMPDIFFYWGVTEANCDWSILYVIVFIFFVFLVISGVCWGLTYTCRNRKTKPSGTKISRPTRPKRPQKYALLHTNDNDEMPSCKWILLFSWLVMTKILFWFRSSQQEYTERRHWRHRQRCSVRKQQAEVQWRS